MALLNLKILVTGASGFIGKNLIVRLNELQDITVLTFVRGDSLTTLPKLVSEADAIIHLAGENRPQDPASFSKVNFELTSALCDAIKKEVLASARHIPLILASSAHALNDNPYGRSKLEAETVVQSLAEETNNPCAIFRLPGVFGKWCRPNYNSVVATFCNNIARDLPVRIDDPESQLRLVYVDDVINTFLSTLEAQFVGCIHIDVEPEYTLSVADLESQIRAFSNCRTTLMLERVGTDFTRALYSTYVSYLPEARFSYPVNQHIDPRGVFVEFLKTPDSGQVSFFSAHPGVTRGGHYHHTKTEKFLVIKGEALFRFRHLLTDELVEFRTSGNTPRVVDTIPGWAHDITNLGDDELLVMLWANENFDRDNPDTISSEVEK